MYYEHEVVVKLSIHTLTDEVKPRMVEEAFNDGHWDYEIVNTSLITPVEIVAKLADHIRTCGLHGFKHSGGSYSDFALELLEVLKDDLTDFQSAYEEAL